MFKKHLANKKIVVKKTAKFFKLHLNNFAVFLTLIAIIFTPLNSAFSAFNPEINYQGKLTNASNVAVADGDYNMEFKLYTASSGGTAIWTETLTLTNRVTVTNGLFSVLLGNVTSLSSIDFNQNLYLGVNIGGTPDTPSWDGEMSPRKQIASVPSAFESGKLDGLDSTQFLRSDDADSMASSSASTLLSLVQSGIGNILSLFDGATEVFTVKDGGNIGIGTTSPLSKLSVEGNSYVLGNSTVTGTITGGTFTDGTFSATSGAFTGVASITDGTASWSSNSLSGFTSISGTTLTDGTASITTGSGTGFTSFTVDNLNLNGAIITSDTGAISFDNENLATTGTITSGLINAQTISSTANFTGSVAVTGAVTGATSYNGLVVTANTGVITTGTWQATDVGVEYGGTGASTLTGLLQGNGTSAITGITGTIGQFPYYNGTNTLAATSTLTILTSGNIGIGTTSPLSKLSVEGNSYVLGNSTVTGTSNFGGIITTNGNWISGDGGAEGISVNSAGNVGIGTTAPGAKLDVQKEQAGGVLRLSRLDNAVAVDDEWGSLEFYGTDTSTNGTNVHAKIVATSKSESTNDWGQLDFYTRNGATLGSKMTIQSAGNVGIGTTAPGLQATANAKYLTVENTAERSNLELSYKSDSLADSTAVGQVSGFAGSAAQREIASIEFRTVGTSENSGKIGFNLMNAGTIGDAEMVIMNTGNVGIGSTTPAQKLSVDGKIYSTTGFQLPDGFVIDEEGDLGSVYTAGAGLTLTTAEFSIGADAIEESMLKAVNSPTDEYFLTYESTTGDFEWQTAGTEFDSIAGLNAIFSGESVASTTWAGATSLTTLGTIATGVWQATDIGVEYGGTGASTLTGLLQGNGTSAVTGITGTTGQFPYYNGTNTLAATSAIFISGSNIGIGTTSPASSLDVAGTGITLGGVTRTTWPIGAGSGAFQDATTYAYYTGGNVGIGTTTVGARLTIADTYSQMKLMYDTDNYVDIGVDSTGSFALTPSSINATTTIGSGDEALRIDSSGNVGIGTTAPVQELDITGDINLQNTTSNDTGVIYKNNSRFIHNFQDATGGGAVPSGSNTFVGIDSGNFTMGSTATQIWHGSYNSALGEGTLTANTTGYYNSAIGYTSQASNTTGYSNASVGALALYSNTEGYYNSALGHGSAYSNTTGNQNTAVGGFALETNTTGSSNTAIGYDAGRYIADGETDNLTGDFNVFLGESTKPLADNDQNEIVIGYNATGLGSNTAVLGNDSITKTILKGNVGIGTTSPSYKLSVNSTSASENLFQIATTTNQNILLVDNDGRVGIGTSTLSNYNLTVHGSLYADDIYTSGSTFYMGGNALLSRTGTVLDFGVETGESIDFTINDTSAMNIATGGNVGIGTTGPGALLHLKGQNVSARGQLTLEATDYTQISMYNGATQVGGWWHDIGGNLMHFGTSVAGGQIQFDVGAGVPKVRIDSSGNVGIGTTAPGAKLEVVAANAPEIRVRSNSGSTNNPTIGLWSDYPNDRNWQIRTALNTLGDLQFRVGASAGAAPSVSVLTMLAGGNVGIGTTEPNQKLTLGSADGTQALSFVTSAYLGDDALIGNIEFSTHGADADYRNLANIKAYKTGTNTNDGDLTFWTRHGADGGTEKMRIDRNGNVGIGTTGPAGKLSNNATTQVNVDGLGMNINALNWTTALQGYTAALTNTNAGAGNHNAGLLIKLTSSDATDKILDLESGGVSRVRVLGNGNVGIGTTGPGYKLEVLNTIGVTGAGASSVNVVSTDGAQRRGYYMGGVGTSGMDMLPNTGEVRMGGFSTADYFPVIYSDGVAAMTFGLGTAPTVTIPGNVGIGTASPNNAKLVISSTDSNKISIDGGSIQNGMRWEAVGGANGFYLFNGTYGTAGFGLYNINTNSSPLWIQNGGNVGIGTTAPGAKLEVSGGDIKIKQATNGFLHGLTVTGTGDDYLSIYSTDSNYSGIQAAYSANYNPLILNEYGGNVGIGTTAPAYQLQLSTDSAAKPGTTTWTVPSDERLKDVNADFTRGLEALSGLYPSYFNYKQDNALGIPSNREYVGLIAQDVQAVIPEAVKEGQDGYLSIESDPIFWTMLNAIKELALKVGSDNITYTRDTLQVLNDTDAPQMKLAYDLENLAEFKVSAVGDLSISSAGKDIRLPDDNMLVCSSGACPILTSPFLGVQPPQGNAVQNFEKLTSGTGNLIVENVAFIAGVMGIGTPAPSRILDVYETGENPQMRVSYDESNFAEMQVNAVGDLLLSSVGKDIRLLDDNMLVCSGGACPILTSPFLGVQPPQGNAVQNFEKLTSGTGNLIVENVAYIAGALGIGTPAPSRILDVYEPQSDPQFRISYDEDLYSEFNVSATGDLTISARGGDISVLNENLRVCSDDGCPTIANEIESSGNIVVENSLLALGRVGIGGTISPDYTLDVHGTLRAYGITDASDARLKTNIRSLSKGSFPYEEPTLPAGRLATEGVRPLGQTSPTLQNIQKLRGVKFEWKNSEFGTGDQIGMIAQEMEQVYPELVSTDNDGYKSVQYGKFTAILLEAVKDLINFGETIEYRSARLEDRTVELEKKNRELENRIKALENILRQ